MAHPTTRRGLARVRVFCLRGELSSVCVFGVSLSSLRSLAVATVSYPRG